MFSSRQIPAVTRVGICLVGQHRLRVLRRLGDRNFAHVDVTSALLPMSTEVARVVVGHAMRITLIPIVSTSIYPGTTSDGLPIPRNCLTRNPELEVPFLILSKCNGSWTV